MGEKVRPEQPRCEAFVWTHRWPHDATDIITARDRSRCRPHHPANAGAALVPTRVPADFSLPAAPAPDPGTTGVIYR